MAGNEIVIDLSKQGDAQSYDVGSLIQQEAREKFKSLAEGFIESIDNKKPRSCFGQLDRVHNTILINGKRGMGKTTFMLSILEELCGNPKPKDDCEQYKKCKDKDENNPPKDTSIPVDMDSLRRDICVLEILDPTLIETKEHVLLNIITKIKTKVEKHRECRQECKERDGDYHEWMKSLKRLAGGVNLLDGVGSDAPLKDKMYEDSALVLEQGLSDAKQGSKLEEHLHEFIKKSLDMLGKKAFLLVFDDIDTSLKEGRDILETLRKYLTSRQLITVMLGDIDLYSTLVRQLQWEKIDPKETLKKYESNELSEKYKKQIDVLEEQYLIKLLKPENRIDLKTIERINREKKYSIKIVFSDGRVLTLDEVMDEFGREILMTAKGYYKPFFTSVILDNPIRSILQVIKGFDSALKQKDAQICIQTIKHTFDLETREFEKAGLSEQIDSLTLLNNYSIYLMNKNIINSNTPPASSLLYFPNECRKVDEIYLTALINNAIKTKQSNMISYFVKAGYTLQAYSQLVTEKNFDSMQFIHHTSIDSPESSYDISKRLLSTYSVGKSSTNIWRNPIGFGCLFLSKARILSAINTRAWLFTSGVKTNGGTFHFISFFNMLGFIAEIMDMSDDQIEQMKKQVVAVANFSEFKHSDFVNEEKELIDIDILNYVYEDELIDKIKVWLSKYRDRDISVPVFVLAKIWERTESIFLDMVNQSNQPSTTDKSFETIALQIKAFLNAVFIEVKSYYGETGHNLRNVAKSGYIFENNIKNNDSESIDLFNFLYECPFFNDYISNTKQSGDEKTDFAKLGKDKQKEILVGMIVKYKYEAELKKYAELANSDKDNFISNKFRKKLVAYKNIQRKNFEELLDSYIK